MTARPTSSSYQDVLDLRLRHDALRADLRACAEALIELLHYVEHNTLESVPLSVEIGECPSACEKGEDAIWSTVRAALARPGVQGALK